MNNEQNIALMAFVMASAKRAAAEEIANIDPAYRQKVLQDQLNAQCRLQEALGFGKPTTGETHGD